LEKESKCAIIVGFYFALSLVGAVVLFHYLESYAEVVNPAYRLGGAVAGYFVIFVTLLTAYSRLIAKPSSTVIKEALKGISKPRGLTEYKDVSRGFSTYYPKKWNVSEADFPPVEFERGDGPSLNIVTQAVEKKNLQRVEKDPSMLTDFLESVWKAMFPDVEIIDKGTIALLGVRCPKFVSRKPIGSLNLRQTQIAYLDIPTKRLHVITWTVSETEYNELSPIFEKILSTFRTS